MNELTQHEKDLLLNGLFRHIERNVDPECYCSEEDLPEMEEAYKKLMKQVFGRTYYEV